ncbi:MAG: mechanosensitive ion channel [Gammaproteobacteria bacterium]|nr:mechanosensitive ion channel [Gammaproteobacteria bacterium]
MEWIQQHASQFVGENAWIAELFIVIFLTLLVDATQKIILRRLQKRLTKTKTIWDDALVFAMRAPVSIIVWIIGLSYVGNILQFKATESIRSIGIIIVVAWALVRFIRQVEERVIRAGEISEDKIDRTTAYAIAQLLRVSVLITAFLVGLQTLGFNISAILAFGGIGGIAVGFAAKDMLANFFGGLMIYLDRPFAVGDWVRSSDRNIEGTVERIGWRLTVIRTFDKRPLYIPNSIFASIAVENPSRMSHRRIYETIGVRYDDVAKVPAIIEDVKAMLQVHPDIAQDQTMIVNFNQFAASSLDFFVYTFTKTTNWIEFHKVKQDVLLKISDIISRHGAEIAFPTSTVHVPEAIRLEQT